MIHEHSTKAQNGMHVEKVWKSLLMQTEFRDAMSCDQNFYRPKMGKKLTSLNRYISVITDIDEKWFVIFEHTINHLSFGYIHLPQLE